ncbi:MAG: GDSL-type esterase/lipase family protein [Candidatus Omnitrophica bacterium]|nr:GDSL-type esterase/lipase family protein [Candidatus Omnitrophota bacterium]
MNPLSSGNKILLVIGGIVLAFCLIEAGLHIGSFFNIRASLPGNDFSKLAADEYVIVCLGDSFTYGIGAGRSRSYPAQLSRILNKRAGRHVFRVINLGVPGSNSTQAVITLKKLLTRLTPDMVIVLAGINDENNFSRVIGKAAWAGIRSKSVLAHSRIYKFFSISRENISGALRRAGQNRDEVHVPRSVFAGNDAGKLIGCGNIARNYGKYREAELLYLKALRIDPENAAATVELGRCLKLRGEYTGACAVLIGLIRRDPRREQALNEIQDILVRENNPDHSVQVYSDLAAEFPGEPYFSRQRLWAYELRAGAELSNRRFPEALADYAKLVEFDPENTAARRQIVRIRKKVARSVWIPYYVFEPRGNPIMNLFRVGIARHIADDKEIAGTILSDNLAQICEICRLHGIRLLFSGYPDEVPLPMREAAQRYAVPLVEHAERFAVCGAAAVPLRFFVSENDTHCTSEGYRVMAENIAECIMNSEPGDSRFR